MAETSPHVITDTKPEGATRIGSVNVNGIRAAARKGMGEWLARRDIDILTLQEVRADGPTLRKVVTQLAETAGEEGSGECLAHP